MKLRVISVLLSAALLISCLPLSLLSLAVEENTAEAEQTDQGTGEEANAVPTKSSQEMVDMLKKLEGFVARAYWDYKQYSVGYGTRCPDDMVAYYQENDITEEEAEALLTQELTSFETAVTDFAVKNELCLQQNEYDALVSFSYNCGGGWMKETTGNMYQAVVSGDKGARIVYGMMLWSKAGGEYVLRNRRIAELNMYLYGEYIPYEYPDNLRYVFLDGAGGTTSYEIHGFDTNTPTPVIYRFKSVPTGPDETGKTVTYEFDGWYTAREGGTKVEVLDESIAKGDVLYAHWKLPSGAQVVIPEEIQTQLPARIEQSGVKIYKGNQTSYAVVRELEAGETVVILSFASVGSRYWGKLQEGWILLDEGKVSAGGVVTGDAVNVRAGAGTGYEVLTQKNNGDEVTILNWKYSGGKMWGQLQLVQDGQTITGWICMDYIRGETYADKTLSGISIQTKPTKLEYTQNEDTFEVAGGTLVLTYTDGTTQVIELTEDMISGFDNTQLGQRTLTVTYQGFTTTFEVEILEPPVSGDINGDGVFNDQDAVYLLYHYFFPEDYPAKGQLDMNGDGKFNDQDAVYLLYSYFFPEDYPLN